MLFILHLLFAFIGVCIYGCCFFGHWLCCNLQRFLSCLDLSIRFYASFLALFLFLFSFSVPLHVIVGHCSFSFFERNCYCFKQNDLFFSSVILALLASRIGEVETSTWFCVSRCCLLQFFNKHLLSEQPCKFFTFLLLNADIGNPYTT